MSGKYTVISTFAGGGGSSLGYHLAGFKEVLAIEWDKNACETLRLNFPDLLVWEKDITKVTGKEILKELNIKKGELDIFDGSPPCQGFSMMGKRKVNDPRNELFLAYCNLLKELQPKVLMMENVSGMMKGKMKGMFKVILQELENSGYNVKCKLMNAKYYNVPQSRERLIFIGVRKDIDIEVCFPEIKYKIITVKEAIKDFENENFETNSNASMMNMMLKVKQGRTAADVMNGSFFGSVRLHYNKPAATVRKTFRKGWNAFYHPKFNRNLSIKELKRICSFPDNYILIGKFEEQWAILGNAVMPNMMKEIALNIKSNILDKYYNQ